MTKISVSKSLAALKRDDEQEFDFGAFTVTLRRFAMANPFIRTEVERVRRIQARRPVNSPDNLEEDVDLFLKISFVSWTLKDDNSKPVPIDQAKEVFLGSKEGNELYFNCIQLAQLDDAFTVDSPAIDEAAAKN